MKGFKLSKFFTLSLSLIYLSGVFSVVVAQEYDDMYFNKSDRKSVKVEKVVAVSDKGITSDYKKITESTEAYSAKNVNPEYIARYKSTEASEQTSASEESYGNKDYFVEDYDKQSYVGDNDKNDIDYEALALRDKMSYSNYNRSYSSPSWRFSPYMSMGMGYGAFGYPRYGYYDPFMMGGYYDPFMMGGYGPGMTMGIGMGYGYGFSPGMSYSIGMSWGSGFGYPGFYSPYGMGHYAYNPWNSMYGFNSFGYGSMYGCSPYMAGRYGLYSSTIVYAYGSGSELYNGRRIEYKPRTTRSGSNVTTRRSNTENLRTSASNDRIRIPNRDVATSASNGRTRSELSRAQNEYYSRSRSSSSSAQRMTSARTSSNRSSYVRNSGSATKASSMYSNKPSRTSSGFTSGSRSYTNRSSYSGNSSNSSNRSSSFSSPGRSNSYSSGSSRSSSFSSGGSRSSGSSYSGSSSSGSRSSGGSSRSGRQ